MMLMICIFHRMLSSVCLNFQHHCRKCGIVVCKDCSSNKWLLPQQASKPLRVCLTCYQGLSHTKATVPVTSEYNIVQYKLH